MHLRTTLAHLSRMEFPALFHLDESKSVLRGVSSFLFNYQYILL